MSFYGFKRNRVVFNTRTKGKTDQAMKKACDINNIMKQCAKTGHFPRFEEKVARFVDNTNMPSLEEAFEVTNLAQEAFLSLPADVRALMGHNPLELENFISNEANHEICLKYGLLEKKVVQKSDTDRIIDALKQKDTDASNNSSNKGSSDE